MPSMSIFDERVALNLLAFKNKQYCDEKRRSKWKEGVEKVIKSHLLQK